MNSKFLDFSTKRGRSFIAIIIMAVLVLIVAFGFEGDLMKSPSTVSNISNLYDLSRNSTLTNTISNFVPIDNDNKIHHQR
ncbi:hypothetical protein [Candidatus Nitrosocosmicus hydrocola]|uniref:hypothetical protein n=1 Tax=Candidatus Nitrosocosmicus hydrocola TaxID=1826872 RepID=UPI0011E5C947|nr:hypothetical protein [Candidatus Nitrosocosmicus hydrocola]